MEITVIILTAVLIIQVFASIVTQLSYKNTLLKLMELFEAKDLREFRSDQHQAPPQRTTSNNLVNKQKKAKERLAE